MSAVSLGLLLVVLPLLPVWMRSVYRRTALLDTKIQVRVFYGFQICLALVIFLSFFLAAFSLFLSYMYLGPYTTGLSAGADYWDAPLTPRGALLLLAILGVPYLVFTKVGLVSIRDSHQICKEQRDRLAKRRKTGWTGV